MKSNTITNCTMSNTINTNELVKEILHRIFDDDYEVNHEYDDAVAEVFRK